jgi:hypothetical protein
MRRCDLIELLNLRDSPRACSPKTMLIASPPDDNRVDRQSRRGGPHSVEADAENN